MPTPSLHLPQRLTITITMTPATFLSLTITRLPEEILGKIALAVIEITSVRDTSQTLQKITTLSRGWKHTTHIHRLTLLAATVGGDPRHTLAALIRFPRFALDLDFLKLVASRSNVRWCHDQVLEKLHRLVLAGRSQYLTPMATLILVSCEKFPRHPFLTKHRFLNMRERGMPYQIALEQNHDVAFWQLFGAGVRLVDVDDRLLAGSSRSLLKVIWETVGKAGRRESGIVGVFQAFLEKLPWGSQAGFYVNVPEEASKRMSPTPAARCALLLAILYDGTAAELQQRYLKESPVVADSFLSSLKYTSWAGVRQLVPKLKVLGRSLKDSDAKEIFSTQPLCELEGIINSFPVVTDFIPMPIRTRLVKSFINRCQALAPSTRAQGLPAFASKTIPMMGTFLTVYCAQERERSPKRASGILSPGIVNVLNGTIFHELASARFDDPVDVQRKTFKAISTATGALRAEQARRRDRLSEVNGGEG